MTQAAYERYPDTTIPSSVPLPAPPSTPEQAVQYLRTLHQWIAADRARLSEILRVLSYHRTTISVASDEYADGGTGTMIPGPGAPAQLPDAMGGGTISVTVDGGEARIFVDTPTVGTPAWVEVKPALDYSDISGNDADTDVTAAELEELTDGSITTLHIHSEIIVNSPEPHDSTLDSNEGTFWYELA